MRALTSIESSTNILTALKVEIAPADGSTTFVHTASDISDITPVQWTVPFAGGFGSPSRYSFTLASSMEGIKTNLSKYINADVRLSVICNSDEFQPHYGRIRDFKRNTQTPDLINFTVYDKFLETNPLFPPTLSDSWSTPHPETIKGNYGIPHYYGKNLQPFYFYAVESDMSTLLGCTNVESENHVNSVYLNNDLSLDSSTPTFQNVLETGYIWDSSSQAPVAYNLTNSVYFEIKNSTDKIFEYSENIPENFVGNTSVLSGELSNILLSDNRVEWKFPVYDSSGVYRGRSRSIFRHKGSVGFRASTLTTSFGGSPFQQNSVFSSYQFDVFEESKNYTTIVQDVLSNVNSTATGTNNFNYTFVFTHDTGNVYSANLEKTGHFLQHRILYTCTTPDTGQAVAGGALIGDFVFDVDVAYPPEAFKNYSIFTTVVNTGLTGINGSDRPVKILEDILSITSVDFNSAGVTGVNNAVDEYSFTHIFDKRTPLDSIIDEYSKRSNFYSFISDSGTLDFKVYANSGTATGSIDFTIGTSDFLNFDLIENPLGSTRFQGGKYSEFKIDFNFDYQKNKYSDSITLNKNNNSYCDSSFNAGVEKSKTIKTLSVVESATAGGIINNFTRLHTQSNEFVKMKLPARFYRMQIADILHVSHPMIIGDSSLYQITELTHDYQKGRVDVLAQEIIDVRSI